MKRQTPNIVHYLASLIIHHSFCITPLALLLLMVTVVLLAGCNPVLPPLPVQRPNVVISVEGVAQLKRTDWQIYSPMGFGTLLQYDDLLQVDGSVQILCGDLTVKTLTSGRDSCPCRPWNGAFIADGAAYRNIPQDVPYIQYPRNTLVLDAQPVFRWHDTGATGYRVAVIQGGRALWQQTSVAGTTLIYPADAPPLTPGVDYLLRVQDEDSGISSAEDPVPGIGFQLITPTQQEALDAYCSPVTALSGLNATARDYALALCYATWEPEGSGRGAWGPAWLLLENVAQTHNVPAVHLWRGDLLRTMQLFDDAIAAYHAAITSAEALGDLESQALGHQHLYELTNDVTHRDAAVEIYEQLGK